MPSLPGPHLHLCEHRRPGFFVMMIDNERQVPAPSAAGWLFVLGDQRGPAFVVLRQDEGAARDCLRDHLRNLGVADELLADASVEYAAVMW
jgi:hypothetical protein